MSLYKSRSSSLSTSILPAGRRANVSRCPAKPSGTTVSEISDDTDVLRDRASGSSEKGFRNDGVYFSTALVMTSMSGDAAKRTSVGWISTRLIVSVLDDFLNRDLDPLVSEPAVRDCSAVCESGPPHVGRMLFPWIASFVCPAL